MREFLSCIGALVCAAASLCACAGLSAEGPKQAVSAPAIASEGETVPVDRAEAPQVVKGEVGSPALDFTGRRTDGGELRLSEEIGRRVIVLQFWGVRCAPCLAEMAFLSELQRKQEGALLVVGVNTDRVQDTQLRQAMTARRISAAYPLVADPDFSISQRYTQWLVPVVVLIDRKGIVRAIHTGFNESLKSRVRSEIEELLGEAR